MELEKGENIMEHEAEIYSRPPRTWFQSQKEKLNAKGAPNPQFSIHCLTLSLKQSAKHNTRPVFQAAGKKRISVWMMIR